jgi:hypothetical protein
MVASVRQSSKFRFDKYFSKYGHWTHINSQQFSNGFWTLLEILNMGVGPTPIISGIPLTFFQV